MGSLLPHMIVSQRSGPRRSIDGEVKKKDLTPRPGFLMLPAHVIELEVFLARPS